MIRKVEIERFSLVTSKQFDDVVAAIHAAIGHPDMADFWRSNQQARSVAELESTVRNSLGSAGPHAIRHIRSWLNYPEGYRPRQTSESSGSSSEIL